MILIQILPIVSIKNVLSFQELLKATGFLRELSDATSIVSNPYNKVQKKGGDEKCDI